MKLCSILPLKYKKLMYKHDYVMLLAHLSKNDNSYVSEAQRHSGECYKIMDNSIIELGDAFSMEDLVRQAIRCQVDEIILPDVFEDGSATVIKTLESIQWLKEHNLLGRFKLMAVCHGKTVQEFASTFEALNSIPEIDTIGIPRILCKYFGSRSVLSNIYLNTDKQLHLLGAYDTLMELEEFPRALRDRIRSVDTCLPALLSNKTSNWQSYRNGDKLDLETGTINEDNYIRIMRDLTKELYL